VGIDEGRHFAVEARNNLHRRARGEEARKQRGTRAWKEEGECEKEAAFSGTVL
jgi:hypothetical protein